MTISLGTGMMELSIAIKAITPRYPPSRTQPNHTCSKPCSILILFSGHERHRLAGTVVADQPVDHFLVDLDLPLFDQHILHAAFEQAVALVGALALDLVANDRTLRRQLRQIRAAVGDHFGHDGASIGQTHRSEDGAVRLAETLGHI